MEGESAQGPSNNLTASVSHGYGAQLRAALSKAAMLP